MARWEDLVTRFPVGAASGVIEVTAAGDDGGGGGGSGGGGERERMTPSRRHQVRSLISVLSRSLFLPLTRTPSLVFSPFSLSLSLS
ncbi:hypothetical protein RIF29_18534 [Crotalaria pallida]|uniref:Uncharacterized protein n=1 Tax=Crotalaria pallida TaxID=3830 RepID=A0AAN9FST9_CROPI